MSENMRVIELFLSVPDLVRLDTSNHIVTTGLDLMRFSHTVIRVHLVNSDVAISYTPDPGSVWAFNADSSFASDHEDLIASDNSMFNIAADWPGGIDIANGKICFRIDTTSTQLAEEVGDAASLLMIGELWMTPPGGNLTLVGRIQVNLYNIVSNVGATSDLIYTTTNLLKFDGDDVVLYYPDGSVAQRWSPK